MTGATCIQRTWRRHVAHARCMRATVQLQAALRRRAVMDLGTTLTVLCFNLIWNGEYWPKRRLRTSLRLAVVLGRKIAPPHGGFESRFAYLYAESTSTTRAKLLNLRVNLRVDS